MSERRLEKPDAPRKVGNVSADKVSTNERRVIPFGRGKYITAALHVGQIYDQYTIDAPVERPGKK